MHQNIKEIGRLREIGWKSMSVKHEMRKNLLHMIKNNMPLFSGILGYEKTVIPQIVNAILAKHDLILLGLRGQAKTRILRMLVSLLDEFIPVIEGSEVNDDPFNPISKFGKEMIARHGDETPVMWVHRSMRYGEKLATPDTSVADLIGDLDPIKAASLKLALASEEVINYGLIPRTNRGIFVINELPDLQPRIQVALLNIMQERDIQIRGFNIRIPLDVSMAFSANPEDYTNRGNIITPLKDRIDSQIITHYPREIDVAIQITEQEAWTQRDGDIKIHIPESYKKVLENVAFEARKSEYIDQKSGVSTRMTITAMEQVVSAAEKRAVLNGEKESVLRITDLYSMIPALTGKLELVYEGEQEGAVNVAKHIIGKAINTTFKEYFPDPQRRKRDNETNEYDEVLNWFAKGNLLEIPGQISNNEYRDKLNGVSGLKEIAKRYTRVQNGELYAIMDLIIEALHQNSKIGKEDINEAPRYTDMLGSMLGDMTGFDEDDYSDI
jgi:magnesium chelatase subunit I